MTEFKNKALAINANKALKASQSETVPTSLFEEKNTKKLTDLIYGSEGDDDNTTSDTFLNSMDTSNPYYKRPTTSKAKITPAFSCAIKSVKSSFESSSEIDATNTSLMRKIYRKLIKPKFVTGSNELAEMQEMPEDEEDKMKLNQNDSDSESEKEPEEEDYIKPHLRNLPTKEELMKMEKRKDFIGESYGYFRCGTYVRIEIEISKQLASLMEPTRLVTLCALSKQEEAMGLMRCKIRKHR